jgi:hypothetical protein
VTVYVVFVETGCHGASDEDGAYSMRIVGVYSTQERAKEVAKAEFGDVEEFIMDGPPA